QTELQFVHVAVIANLLGLGDCLKTSPQIPLDIRGDVRIPPMAVGDHVGEDPTVAYQFLVLSAAQDGDTERHGWKRVQKLGILDQGRALIEKVLPLVDAVFEN